MDTNNEITTYNGEDVEDLILSLSDNILLFNIRDQIKENNTDSEIDYLSIIFNKINACEVSIDKNNKDLLNTIGSFKNDMINKIIDIFNENLNINIELKQYYIHPEKLLRIIYEFFVLRREKNLVNLIFSFIKINEKDLLQQFKKSLNKKDLTYVNNKKEIKESKIILLMNILDIFNFVQLDSPEDILELEIIDKNELINEFVLDLVEKEEITFNEGFVDQIKDNLSNNKIKIISDLKNKITESEEL